MDWTIHHRAITVSTNRDARQGMPGDVFTADFQTAGRGRLDHRWLSPPGSNLMMSVVVSAAEASPEEASTLPLAVGLAVARAVRTFLPSDSDPLLKWPNDILVNGRKLAGILCERVEDRVIAGIGVNVAQTDFQPEIAARATSLALLAASPADTPGCVRLRDAVLAELSAVCERWRQDGFAALYPALRTIDFLRGRVVSVGQTDDDRAPLIGRSGGILPSGALDVAGQPVFAGEAHVMSC